MGNCGTLEENAVVLRMLKVSFQVCPPISWGTLVGGTLDLRLLLRIATKFGWWIISRF
jgi:hypothetical protein